MEILLKTLFLGMILCPSNGEPLHDRTPYEDDGFSDEYEEPLQYTTNKCGPQEWQCKNYDCISSYDVCDGRRDCNDGSDETKINCADQECPLYAFQCNYGACIDENLKCNGAMDCIDGSDEENCKEKLTGHTNDKITFPDQYYQIIKDNQDKGKKNCLKHQWECSDGECIALQNRCDGHVDCNDFSDESFGTCHDLVCPRYLFQCAYGACIDSDAKCDGVQDCRDNSDELNQDCIHQSVTSTCPRNNFQCLNSECIPRHLLCDGEINCSDGSDETIFPCIMFVCPKYLFKCAYGACIDNEFKCDGVRDCADGSDEDEEVCKDTLGKHTSTKQNGCELPSDIEGKYLFNENSGILADGKIQSNTLIEYKCFSGEKGKIICKNGTWTEEVHCSRACPEITSKKASVTCWNKDKKQVACYHKMYDGYSVKALCKNQKDDNKIFCNEGQWSRDIPTCEKGIRIVFEYNDGLKINVFDVNGNEETPRNRNSITLFNNSSRTVYLSGESNEAFEFTELGDLNDLDVRFGL